MRSVYRASLLAALAAAPFVSASASPNTGDDGSAASGGAFASLSADGFTLVYDVAGTTNSGSAPNTDGALASFLADGFSLLASAAASSTTTSSGGSETTTDGGAEASGAFASLSADGFSVLSAASASASGSSGASTTSGAAVPSDAFASLSADGFSMLSSASGSSNGSATTTTADAAVSSNAIASLSADGFSLLSSLVSCQSTSTANASGFAWANQSVTTVHRHHRTGSYPKSTGQSQPPFPISGSDCVWVPAFAGASSGLVVPTGVALSSDFQGVAHPSSGGLKPTGSAAGSWVCASTSGAAKDTGAATSGISVGPQPTSQSKPTGTTSTGSPSSKPSNSGGFRLLPIGNLGVAVTAVMAAILLTM